MPRGKTRTRRQNDNSLRIIAGQWRGRRLSFPDVEGLRPTGDRLRETLFNWLAGRIRGARCLDLFAGSGALGLEAASRGAAHVSLVDSSAAVCRTLEAHRHTLGAEQVIEVIRADAAAWLTTGHALPFDVVFLDPPFASPLLQPALAALQRPGCLAADARVYVEAPREAAVEVPPGWEELRSIETGNVHCRLLAGGGQ